MTNQTQPAARQPKKRSAWVVGGATILSFVALLYVVEAFDQLDGHRWDDNGIRPLETDGLWGILFAPLLHANWAHLAANTGPALVLGFLVALAGLSRFVWATAIIWIVGGLGTWLIGNMGSACGETDHIGASGLIFGWLTFLLVFGFFIRSGWQIVIGLRGTGCVRRGPVGGGAGAQCLRRRVLAGASLRRNRRGGGRVPAVEPGTQSSRYPSPRVPTVPEYLSRHE
jgi:membrane associated rhomboid family serine protease